MEEEKRWQMMMHYRSSPDLIHERKTRRNFAPSKNSSLCVCVRVCHDPCSSTAPSIPIIPGCSQGAQPNSTQLSPSNCPYSTWNTEFKHFIPKELGLLGWHRSHSAAPGRSTRHIPLHNAALRYNYFCNIVIYVAWRSNNLLLNEFSATPCRDVSQLTARGGKNSWRATFHKIETYFWLNCTPLISIYWNNKSFPPVENTWR